MNFFNNKYLQSLTRHQMIQMKQAPTHLCTIRHRMELYDLKVTYEPPLETGNEKLEIYLKINSSVGIQTYRSIFNNQTMNHETVSIFSGLDIIFECFRQQSGYEVDFKNGAILLKGVFEIKGRRIQKKSLIQLEKLHLTEHQTMVQQIKELEEQVHLIKNSKQERDNNLKKEYEKRFQQQKKKLEENIQQSKEQEQFKEKKQKELEKHIAELESKLSELTRIINSFSKHNKKQIQQLKNVSQSCQHQIQIAQEEYDNHFLFLAGKHGRKRRKENENEGQKKRQRRHKHKTLPEEIPQFVDRNSQNLDCFLFESNKITLVKNSQCSLMLGRTIPKNEYLYSFKVIVTKAGSIIFGVAERQSMLQRKYCKQEDKAIGYWGSAGYIWGCKKFEREGFKALVSGDIVQVYIELDKPYIEWRINDVLVSFCEPELLADSSLTFVPFIEMEHRGDCVQWIDL